MPNPPPSWNPKRTNARVGPLRLPAGGRPGPAPKWPLSQGASAPEKKAWSDLWKTPQAVAWEQMGVHRVVARYCRVLVRAEQRGAPFGAMAEARQYEDRLGMTPKAMRNLLWIIDDTDETAEKREKPKKRPVVAVEDPDEATA